MVALNDLIICLPISNPDFNPRNSFLWKSKTDSIEALSNLKRVIKKESAGINYRALQTLHQKEYALMKQRTFKELVILSSFFFNIVESEPKKIDDGILSKKNIYKYKKECFILD